MTSCSAYELGELAGGSDRWSGTGWVLFIGWGATELRITCFVHILITIIVMIIISSFAFLSNCLSQPTSFTFFSPILPSPQQVDGGGEQAPAWCLVASWG